jgi:hypothetical protein
MAAPDAPLDALVEKALDRAYLSQLSDVGRGVLLQERQPTLVELEPEPEPEDRPFFSHSNLPPPGWQHREELQRAERAAKQAAEAAAEALAAAAELREAQPELEPEPEPEPEREPKGGGLKAAYSKLLAQGKLDGGADGGAVGKAIAELGQKVLGTMALRLEHRRRAADVRNAQLVANSARAKEVRLRSEAAARTKEAHAAMMASARYTSFRPASWRQHGESGGGGGGGSDDAESWRNIPYDVPKRPGTAWLDPTRTPADAAQLVSEGVQAMAQKQERANRLVVTERHGDQSVQIHRLQPPPAAPAHTASRSQPSHYRPSAAEQTRAGRAARTLRRERAAPSSPRSTRKGQVEAGGGSARAHVISGGFELGPGLNGSAETAMTLRDGEHQPLPAQFISHHTPVPPSAASSKKSAGAGGGTGTGTGRSSGGACRVLISAATETAASCVSPGPAAYYAEVAHARLHSPRSFMRSGMAIGFGTTSRQRPLRVTASGSALVSSATDIRSAAGGGGGERGGGGGGGGGEARIRTGRHGAVAAVEGGAWGQGLGVFEETSWSQHIPLVKYTAAATAATATATQAY